MERNLRIKRLKIIAKIMVSKKKLYLPPYNPQSSGKVERF